MLAQKCIPFLVWKAQIIHKFLSIEISLTKILTGKPSVITVRSFGVGIKCGGDSTHALMTTYMWCSEIRVCCIILWLSLQKLVRLTGVCLVCQPQRTWSYHAHTQVSSPKVSRKMDNFHFIMYAFSVTIICVCGATWYDSSYKLQILSLQCFPQKWCIRYLFLQLHHLEDVGYGFQTHSLPWEISHYWLAQSVAASFLF